MSKTIYIQKRIRKSIKPKISHLIAAPIKESNSIIKNLNDFDNHKITITKKLNSFFYE